jgi:acyl-CoA reductase-like NAD-dependent aldehyde dehydrogenase
MNGNSLIAGEWLAGEGEFLSAPATGEPKTYSMGTAELVDRACVAAEEAFWSYGYSSRAARAAFLDRIADEIEVRGAQITEIGSAETGLPAARLDGERGRTTGQLRLFAEHIRTGDYLDLRHDPALPDRQPMPRPDLKMAQRPIGSVAVFGASNFPLAFSTAGGDTAAALAAGCPVVVKGHTAHPGTGEIVAEAVEAARRPATCIRVFSLSCRAADALSAPRWFNTPSSRPWVSPGRWAAVARCLISARRDLNRSRSLENLARSTRCSSCPRRSLRGVQKSVRAGPGR